MTAELQSLALQQSLLYYSSPHSPLQGVSFSVRVKGLEHPCLIADSALQRLYAFEGTTLDIQHVYRAYETKIHKVARNLILSGKGEPLLVLRAPHFSSAEV